MSLNRKPDFVPTGTQSNDVDIREIIRQSDRRARHFFESHVERPLFPYSGHRLHPEKVVTSETES